MICGLGIDAADTGRIAKTYERFPERFPSRILTAAEQRDFRTTGNPVRFLAMRFAAKEAASKALGTGFKQGVAPASFSVYHEASGKPGLTLEGRARELGDRLEVNSVHLSLTDEAGMVFAVVIFER